MERFNVDWGEGTNLRNHHHLMPKSFRALIVGSSGCGKTNLLLKMLIQPNWLDYNRLYIVGNSLFQPKYDIIKTGFENGLSKQEIQKVFTMEEKLKSKNITYKQVIEEMGTKRRSKPIEVFFTSESSDIPDPKDLDKNYKNLIVFDDIMENKCQNIPQSYYTRGRHSNVDCIYISQNYFKLDRQSIRSNTNLFILFQLPGKDIKHIWEDHVAQDMKTFQEFETFCEECWKTPFDFVVIDLSQSAESGLKYRKNFVDRFIPDRSIAQSLIR